MHLKTKFLEIKLPGLLGFPCLDMAFWRIFSTTSFLQWLRWSWLVCGAWLFLLWGWFTPFGRWVKCLLCHCSAAMEISPAKASTHSPCRTPPGPKDLYTFSLFKLCQRYPPLSQVVSLSPQIPRFASRHRDLGWWWLDIVSIIHSCSCYTFPVLCGRATFISVCKQCVLLSEGHCSS